MLAENPIAKFEFAALQRTLGTKRTGYWLRLVFYFGILLVAAIPLFIYIDETLFPVLVLMLIIIFLAQLILTLNTLAQAIEQTLHQRQNGMWDVLILTGMSARQMMTGKSNAIVRALWAEWVILALARFGAAYGLSQYFMAGGYFSCLSKFPDAFCYMDWTLRRYPGMIEIILALSFILIMTRHELRLVALIGMNASLFASRNRIFAWVVAALIWSMLSFGAVTGMYILDNVTSWIYSFCYSYSDCRDLAVGYPHGSDADTIYQSDNLRRFLREISLGVTFIQSGLSAVGDSGTLLAAQILRPENFLRFRHLLRCFIGVALALGAYQSLNWIFLTVAQRLAIKQGALPEAHKRIKINKLYWLKRITGFA